jgi:taurine transport system permease protein
MSRQKKQGVSSGRFRLKEVPGLLAQQKYPLISIGSICVFFILWEFLTTYRVISPVFLPSPSKIFSEAVKLIRDGTLQGDVLISAKRVLGGFALAAVIGVPLGILLGTSRFLRAVFDPIISIIRPLPALSWIPLSMLWLGIGETQKYSIVFMGTFCSVLLYVIEATYKIDPILIRAAQNLGASRLQVMKEVILPGALPNIISGLKVVLAIAWTCIISTEMVGASEGLGFRIWNAKDWGNTPQVLVGMLGISLTVLAIDTGFGAIEKKLIPWERT